MAARIENQSPVRILEETREANVGSRMAVYSFQKEARRAKKAAESNSFSPQAEEKTTSLFKMIAGTLGALACLAAGYAVYSHEPTRRFIGEKVGQLDQNLLDLKELGKNAMEWSAKKLSELKPSCFCFQLKVGCGSNIDLNRNITSSS